MKGAYPRECFALQYMYRQQAKKKKKTINNPKISGVNFPRWMLSFCDYKFLEKVFKKVVSIYISHIVTLVEMENKNCHR